MERINPRTAALLGRPFRVSATKLTMIPASPTSPTMTLTNGMAASTTETIPNTRAVKALLAWVAPVLWREVPLVSMV